jgi:hypothetical protein
MSWTRNYLELKVASTTLRYRVLLEESNMRGRLQLASHQRNLDGQTVSVRSLLNPVVLRGFILVKDGDSAPYGTLAQLETWWNSTALEARRMGDSDFWAAVIQGDWEPKPFEQMDYYYAVPVNIEQKQ